MDKNLKENIKQHESSLGILVILTYYCNFKCITCADPLTNTPGHINEILDENDFEDFMSFILQANEYFEKDKPKFEWISFTGGEVTTLPLKKIEEMCEIAHGKGFKTSIFTNGSFPDKLIKLDGVCDQMVISHHSQNSVLGWANHFTKTKVVVNKLVGKESFPTFKSFDKFVDEIRAAKVNYRQRFSTYGYNTPEFKEHHPLWVDSFVANRQSLTQYSQRYIYKDMEFKFSGNACMIAKTFIQHPNGNVNTTWEDDIAELDFRDSKNLANIPTIIEQLNNKFKIQSN